MLTRPYAYIPTGHTLPLNKLDQHEYFGQDMKDGNSGVALFRTEKGALKAVWSFGSWESSVLIEGDEVAFQHTQTRRKTILKFVEFLPSPTISSDKRRAVQWTLK